MDTDTDCCAHGLKPAQSNKDIACDDWISSPNHHKHVSFLITVYTVLLFPGILK